ncbi:MULTISPECIES: hypothetical protein [unclassified Endozoicomonas]|uniref:hypothetical protein n=1 Tax=unclassified Endozoicomonas TaxID=2644528 RepID=UPI003BB603C1
MSHQDWQLLISNLIARIEIDGVTGQKRLPGIITNAEYAALQGSLEQFENGSTPQESPHQPATIEHEHQQSAIEEYHFDFNFGEDSEVESTIAPEEKPEEAIVLQEDGDNSVKLELQSTLIDTADNGTTYLCIDFGTALSKACMVTRDDGYEEVQPLPLGKEAGQENYMFPVVSSVYIGLDDRIYFGQKAIDRSLEERGTAAHARFDSLKSYMMSHPEEECLDTVIAEPFCPAGVSFSVGALISFYLAYVTDLIDQTAMAEYDLLPYTLRRYAMPCFPDSRKAWVEKELATYLARAQILGDTFSDEWYEGIPVNKATSAWQQILKLPQLPRFLVDGSVTEPLAVISSRISPDSSVTSKALMVVIDVGAGTTDFTLFQMNVDAKQQRYQAIEVDGSAISLNKAGDYVDQVLMSTLLKQASITVSHPDYKAIVHDMKLKIRSMKERLFKEKTLEYYLFDGSAGDISLESFINLPEIRAFAKDLQDTFMRVLDSIDPSWLTDSQQGSISVTITGGGANMPMLQELTRGQVYIHGISLNRSSPTPHVPQWIEDESDLLAQEYNQLAVSIGGARKNVINRQATQKQYSGSRLSRTAANLEVSIAR